jgi:Tfp pilus assembly protein PilO
VSRQPVPATSADEPGEWHLDRRVPLALLCALFVQLVAGIYWASSVSHDLVAMKSDIATLTEDLKSKSNAITEIIALKAEQRHVVQTLERLERAVERLSRLQRVEDTQVPRTKARP